MSAQATRKYRQVDLASASPQSILQRLFLRCLRDLDDAKRAIESSDVAARAAAIDHGFSIVVELRAALDIKADADLCGNLAALYDFVLELLSAANSQADLEALGRARDLMAHIAESFRMASAR